MSTSSVSLLETDLLMPRITQVTCEKLEGILSTIYNMGISVLSVDINSSRRRDTKSFFTKKYFQRSNLRRKFM